MLQLQEVVSWSWFVVLLPGIVLELFYIGFSCFRAPKAWKSQYHVVETESDRMYFKEKSFWILLLNAVKWRVLILLSFLLIASVADGSIDTTFFIGILPLLVGAVLKIIWSALHPLDLDEIDPETGQVLQPTEEEKKSNNCAIPWAQILCVTGPWVVMLCLAAAKLDDMSAFSAFIIFIPVFVVSICNTSPSCL